VKKIGNPALLIGNRTVASEVQGVVSSHVEPVEAAFCHNVLEVVCHHVSGIDKAVDSVEALGLLSILERAGVHRSIITSHAFVLETFGSAIPPGLGSLSVDRSQTVDGLHKDSLLGNGAVSGRKHGLVVNFAVIFEHAGKVRTVNLVQVGLGLGHTLLSVVGNSVD